MSDVRVTLDESRSRYEAWIGDKRAGVLEYVSTPGTIDFTHTVVDEQFGGRGVGSALVRTALDDAREAAAEGDVHVIPTCPFVAGYIDKHPEYADLL